MINKDVVLLVGEILRLMSESIPPHNNFWMHTLLKKLPSDTEKNVLHLLRMIISDPNPSFSKGP